MNCCTRNAIGLSWVGFALGLSALLVGGGCGTPAVRTGQVVDKRPLQVQFTNPLGAKIKVGSKTITAGSSEKSVVELRIGRHGFEIKRVGKPTLTGVLRVVDVDDKSVLTTFDTGIKQDLLDSAWDGKLATYEITFGGKKVIEYFLGNRRKPAVDWHLKQTIELLFDGPGSAVYRVGGKRAHAIKRTVLTLPFTTAKSHEFSLETFDKKKYSGFLKMVRFNPYAAVCKINASIPEEQLREADTRKVVTYSIKDESTDETLIEISFGRKIK